MKIVLRCEKCICDKHWLEATTQVDRAITSTGGIIIEIQIFEYSCTQQTWITIWINHNNHT